MYPASILSLLLLSLTTPSISVPSRGGGDPPPSPNFLRCHRPLPPEEWLFWPSKYRPSVSGKPFPFTSVRHLCAAVASSQSTDPLQNAGCACAAPADPAPECQRRWADDALWGNPAVMQLCTLGCRCSQDLEFDENSRMSFSEEEDESAFNDDDEAQSMGRYGDSNGDYYWTDSDMGDGDDGDGWVSDRESMNGDHGGRRTRQRTDKYRNSAPLRLSSSSGVGGFAKKKQEQCRVGSCSGMAKGICGGGIAGLCVCGAQLILGVGAGLGKYRGICRGAVSGGVSKGGSGLGGRALPGMDEGMVDMPCACNTSYVSKGCCGALGDGLVWESPAARLGVLVDEAEL